MTELVHSPPAPTALLRGIVELGKPRITGLVVFTAAIGRFLAPVAADPAGAAAFLCGTALLVASANTLNCWMERESDARMVRTRDRVLPSGRIEPSVALAAGIVEGATALALLALVSNALVVLLGAIAHVTYVLAYTPLKRMSPVSLLVGAVPGAIPPLMGWAAATGSLAAAGWELFGILFFWQIPHFIAVALYLEEDYRRGGSRVLSVARGGAVARRHLVAGTVALVAVSFLAVPLGMAGMAYLAAASLLGTVFLGFSLGGLRRGTGGAWARRTFLYSLVYLTLLVTVLLLDAR
jgi:protoheme IX farnesyltransferase